MNTDRIYLLTGAAGFLGSNICLQLLKAGGFRMASYGPEDYEDDTRYRHMPITVRYYTAINCENEQEVDNNAD